MIVDALRIKIEFEMKRGVGNPLNISRNQYSRPDFAPLTSEIEKAKVQTSIFLIDLTPFVRIGAFDELLERLSNISDVSIGLLVCQDFANDERPSIENSTLPVFEFDFSGKFREVHEKQGLADTSIKDYFQRVSREEASKTTLRGIRKTVAQQNLENLLGKDGAVHYPEKPLPFVPVTVPIKGQSFQILPNGMLVSRYINFKQMGRDIPWLIRLAYEPVLEFMDYFLSERISDSDNKVPVNGSVEFIVVPNQTALFVASMVQKITRKQVVVIDKLGPIPRLHAQEERLKNKLAGKDVAIFVEVTGTGSEIDRTIMFLNFLGARVKKIIALYDMEIGRPYLADGMEYVSLCKPKGLLEYVFTSRP